MAIVGQERHALSYGEARDLSEVYDSRPRTQDCPQLHKFCREINRLPGFIQLMEGQRDHFVPTPLGLRRRM